MSNVFTFFDLLSQPKALAKAEFIRPTPDMKEESLQELAGAEDEFADITSMYVCALVFARLKRMLYIIRGGLIGWYVCSAKMPLSGSRQWLNSGMTPRISSYFVMAMCQQWIWGRHVPDVKIVKNTEGFGYNCVLVPPQNTETKL